MARKAVASTLTSVLLFTVLLLANATVLAGQGNLAASAQTAEIESREALLEQALRGTVALDLLAEIQGHLSSSPAECASLPRYLSSINASSSVSGEDTGISYVADGAAIASTLAVAPADNLTLVAPFSGGAPGALNLTAVLSVGEIGGGGSVSLERNETHTLHLPIAPDSASSLCASTMSALAAALSRSPCNATLEQAAFEAVLPEIVQEAAAEGFSLTAGWGGSCAVTYWFTLVELGVEGVAGSFEWTVQGSGRIA